MVEEKQQAYVKSIDPKLKKERKVLGEKYNALNYLCIKTAEKAKKD